MYSTIMTSVLDGIRTIPVCVEVDINDGMPVFDMIGNINQEVREAKERVKTALHNCGIVLPAKRITVNLAPGNIRKSGTAFDLPIAVGILSSMGMVDDKLCANRIFAGELNLKGELLPVNGVLPIVSDGFSCGCEEFLVPMGNYKEAELVRGAKVYGFTHLKQVMEFLNGAPYQIPEYNYIEEKTLEKRTYDFSEVNGQQYMKRACEVSASGMHNLLMVGPPGAGKTMISERMPTILPPLDEEEKLELSKIYSVCGMLSKKNRLLSERPFRNPHHTITRAGLTGGGAALRPGEISLAHQGVLFLDELTEFDKATLEILRQPLEEHEIHLVRASGAATYPASVLLLAAMNPCACGYYPDMQKCSCTPAMLKRYLNRISQPLLDRIDICVEASVLSYEELTGSTSGESSEKIRERVVRCHQIQRKRFSNENFSHNTQIPVAKLKEYCPLGEKQQHYMEHMYSKMGMTGRTYHKILRVARTIADMDESSDIQMKHLNEAVCYRSVNEKFWGGSRG